LKKIPSFHLFFLIFSVYLLVSLSSCLKIDVFEKNVEIPAHEWKWDNKPAINFTITDTTSAYTVFITLRHTDAYEYRNLWLEVYTRLPGDTVFNKERIELPLQSSDGHWLNASGMDDIWEHRIPLFHKVKFTRIGTYTVQLEQVMRDNPLKHIMNVGVRIEKNN
jgi:gliding motility-associated lipoprotein GldH